MTGVREKLYGFEHLCMRLPRSVSDMVTLSKYSTLRKAIFLADIPSNTSMDDEKVSRFGHFILDTYREDFLTVFRGML